MVREEQKIVDLYLEDKIDKVIYDNRFIKIRKEKVDINKKIDSIGQEILLKERFKEKNLNVNNVLRSIKDNKTILKKTIDSIVIKIVIYPIITHNIKDFIKVNKQDVFVFIDVFTFMNEEKPLSFIVSQREKNIITPKEIDFDRTTKILTIGKSIFENEEEETSIDIRPLFHLTSLS